MWPEGDVFGSADVEPEEELELLKQILHANLPSKFLKSIFTWPFVLEQYSNLAFLILGSTPPEPVVEEEYDAAELEDEELESVQVSEKEFSFLDFIKRWGKRFKKTM